MNIFEHEDPASSLSEASPVTIMTADRVKLAGTYYPRANCIGAVLVCPSIGARQESYADFACWLNEQGFAVLTIDYRGMAESLFGESIKYSLAKLHEWGQYDMAIALSYLSGRHPGVPLHIVGHNITGVLMGLMPNHSQISGIVSVGGTALFVPQMVGISRFIANLFFRFYIPLCLAWFGYVPLKCFGQPADIPAGVASQWALWSLCPGYIRNSFGAEIKKHFYREVHSPMLVLCTETDPNIGKASLGDMTDLYRSAVIDCKKIAPRNHSFRKINHLKFFHPKYKKLWPIVADWLKAPERQTIRTVALKIHSQRMAEDTLTYHPEKSKVCAATRTRLGSQKAIFVGASSKKFKISNSH